MSRLLALDLDGTTLRYDGTMSAAVRDAIIGRPQDVQVVIATGRSIVATTDILWDLGLTTGFAVCSNGAVTLRLDPGLAEGFEIIDTVTFDPRPVLERLRVELPDARVAVEELGVGFKLSAPFPDGELMGEQRIVDWEELVAHPVTRVTLRQPESTADEFKDMVDRIGLHGVSYGVGFTAWLDINPEGVSKASALEIVRRELHVEPWDTIAVGDQRNDMEMLRWAARGVAMDNAPDEVKACANEVTGSIDEDGLAQVLASL